MCVLYCELFWTIEECSFDFMNMVLEYTQVHC